MDDDDALEDLRQALFGDPRPKPRDWTAQFDPPPPDGILADMTSS